MNKIFKPIIFALFIFQIAGLQAQQMNVSNFYVQNPFVFNPAAIGYSNEMSAFIEYSNQWTGLKSAPEVGTLGFKAAFAEKMGIGLQVTNQKHGIFNEFYADVKYSYAVKLAEAHMLALGVSAGVQQNDVSVNGIMNYDNTDPALYSNKFDEILLNTGFGLMYNWKSLDVHVALPLAYGMQESRFGQSVYAMASYKFMLMQDKLALTPSALFRGVHTELYSGDFNVNALWDNLFWLQAGYRTNGDIITAAGLKLDRLNIGYSYLIDRTELSIVSTGTHQIYLNFNFRKE